MGKKKKANIFHKDGIMTECPVGGLAVILSVIPLLPQSNKILKLKKNVEKVVSGLWMKHTEPSMKGNSHGATHG